MSHRWDAVQCPNCRAVVCQVLMPASQPAAPQAPLLCNTCLRSESIREWLINRESDQQ